MTLQEFDEYLKNLNCLSDKIVYMRFKHLWEKDWTYSNEILTVDMSSDNYYVWLNDWNEGQHEIEILGCIAIDDVDVPHFNKNYIAVENSTKVEKK